MTFQPEQLCQSCGIVIPPASTHCCLPTICGQPERDKQILAALDDESIVYYGPHLCDLCGTRMICKTGNGYQPTMRFDYPGDIVYPNHNWILHRCPPKPICICGDEIGSNKNCFVHRGAWPAAAPVEQADPPRPTFPLYEATKGIAPTENCAAIEQAGPQPPHALPSLETMERLEGKKFVPTSAAAEPAAQQESGAPQMPEGTGKKKMQKAIDKYYSLWQGAETHNAELRKELEIPKCVHGPQFTSLLKIRQLCSSLYEGKGEREYIGRLTQISEIADNAISAKPKKRAEASAQGTKEGK